MIMNKKLKEMLEELSPILILYGVLFVALSGDAYTDGSMNFGEYLMFALKLFIPGFIGILIKILLYIDKIKSTESQTKSKAIIIYASENPKNSDDKRFSEIMNVLDNVNKIK